MAVPLAVSPREPRSLGFIVHAAGALLLTLVTVSGCVHPSALAERRAHYDLDCANGEITMTTLVGDTYIARGCGKKAVYTCVDSASARGFEHRWSCIKEN